MRYILLTSPQDSELDPAAFQDTRVVLCEDMASVEKAMPKHGDWMLFEVMGGRAKQRSVCFHPDCKRIKSIQ